MAATGSKGGPGPPDRGGQYIQQQAAAAGVLSCLQKMPVTVAEVPEFSGVRALCFYSTALLCCGSRPFSSEQRVDRSGQVNRHAGGHWLALSVSS